MGYKAYSDNYLMSLTKPQIIELLRTAEHNFFATEEALNNSAKAGMEIAEKYDKAKQLLKAAVEDFAVYGALKDLSAEQRVQNPDWRRFNRVFDVLDHQWRYADEALKLIGDE